MLAVTRHLVGAPVRAIAYRRLARPLRGRLHGSHVVRARDGLRLRVDLGDIAGAMLATSGVWEPNVTAAIRSLVRPGDVMVDVGANIGYFSLLAARLAGPSGTVYALEPAASTYAELCANIALNRAVNVVPLQVAAGAEEALLPLRVPRGGNSGRASLVEWPGTDAFVDETVIVPVAPLAALVRPDDQGRVAVVKVDVEGYEEPVLRGLEPVLERGVRPVVVLEAHGPFLEQLAPYLEGFCERFEFTPYELLDLPGERVSISRRALGQLLGPLALRDLRNGRNVALVLLPRGARPEQPRGRMPGSGRR